MRYQAIYDIAELCSRKGLRHAILCPGSRSAPLTTAFVRHPGITCRTMSDERSAAFIALGIAQQTKVPVILVCTSGSAAYNFAPAIAEAYYQNIPLVVFTADRPIEWLNQYDGQTIQQRGIFGNHVKTSFVLPQDYEPADATWHIHRIVNEAINESQAFPPGPVHINAPFREPLYPAAGHAFAFTEELKIIDPLVSDPQLSDKAIRDLQKSFSSFNKVLIVAGQGDHDEQLLNRLERFAKHQRVAVIGDVISNIHGMAAAVRLADSFLGPAHDSLKSTLQPDLLVTFGKSIIAKNLKLFLRRYKPQEHWHIQPSGTAADTFQALTRLIESAPVTVIDVLMDAPRKASRFEAQRRDNFSRLWEAEEHRTQRSMEAFYPTTTKGEMSLVNEVMGTLPPRCNLHLANSMTVRYATFVGLRPEQKGVHVFCNRGTSGIDGCNSTAVGHALASDVPNFLITGDVAFFYDRNAFWHNYPLPNLRIIVLNNHGGSIFNIIDGPSELPEKDEYFITHQALSAESLAEEFGFDYFRLDHPKKWKQVLREFYTFDGKTKIIELDADPKSSKSAYEQFKEQIKKGYEN